MNNRNRRLAELIRQELAGILMREMKDPRVSRVSFTAVDVSPDLEHAKVWFTAYTGKPEDALQGLQRASGYLRSELAQRIKMRIVPKLTFQYDASIERGAHLSQLIDSAVEQDRQHHQDHPDDEAQG